MAEDIPAEYKSPPSDAYKPRRPTVSQRFFASGWFERLWLTVIPLATATVVGGTVLTYLEPLTNGWDLAKFVFYILAGLLLGFMLCLFPGWLIIGPLYYGRAIINGGPFKVGDVVQILTPTHRGRISRVYSLWQYETVRVYLDDESAEKIRDVFGSISLLRVEAENATTEPSEP